MNDYSFNRVSCQWLQDQVLYRLQSIICTLSQRQQSNLNTTQPRATPAVMFQVRQYEVTQYTVSDVNDARTLKAKAKAMAIPMQRLTMKYEVMKSCFFRVLLQVTRIQAQFNNITHH